MPVPPRPVRSHVAPLPRLLLGPLLAGLLPGAAGAAGDAAHGAELFKANCARCHATTAETGTGPGLAGVVDRKSGEAPGYGYSRAMRRAALVWDDATLGTYLADPPGTVPGTKMPFSAMGSDQDRADVIAYLHTLE